MTSVHVPPRPVRRASPDADVRSPWSWLTRHAAERGDDVAYVVGPGAGRTLTWTEVRDAVALVVGGLLESGLRPGDVVVSLLPAGHDRPELDLALRTMGAVVVHVSPRAGADEVRRELEVLDVRLVLVERSGDLARVRGADLDATDVLVPSDGPGWRRLLGWGAERLAADPELVSRVEAGVDRSTTGPRLLRPGARLGRVVPGVEIAGGHGPDLMPYDAVVLLVGEASDPFVHAVGDAHLAAGSTLVRVGDPHRMAGAIARHRPSVVALSAEGSTPLDEVVVAWLWLLPRRRPEAEPETDLAARRAFGGSMTTFVVPTISDFLLDMVDELGLPVTLIEVRPPADAYLSAVAGGDQER